MLKPKAWTAFANAQEKLAFLKEFGLVPKSQNYIKQFFYSGVYTQRPAPCAIEGHCEGKTLVIRVAGELHCIQADYLQDMQAGHYRSPEEYIVLDLETTGLDPRRDKIVEFAGVRYYQGRQEESLSMLINPGCSIPPEATRVNQISDEMVADAPSMEHALPQISAFLGDTPLVAHNASFDISFLKIAYQAAGLPFQNAVFDTLALCRRAFPGRRNYSLSSLKQYFSIETGTAHRALPDVLATAEVFAACAAALSEVGLR